MPGWIDTDMSKDPSDYSEGQNETGAQDAAAHWSLPWSDLMMTLFVMFAMILSTQHYGPKIVERFQTQAESAAPAPKKSPILFPSGEVVLSPKTIYTLSHEAIKTSNLEAIDMVLEEDESVRISVQGPLFFDLGSTALNAETMGFLKVLSGILQKSNNEIQVIGHTDDRPVRSALFPTNWELSAARAAAVARYLIDAGGLAPGRFSIVGRAMYQPLLPNITEAHRQRNRRVDILITKNQFQQIEAR